MSLQDFRGRRDEAQRIYREARERTQAIMGEIQRLNDDFTNSVADSMEARRQYHDTQELFRVAREFGVQDINEARMIAKLRAHRP